jgi:hypothetical protein
MCQGCISRDCEEVEGDEPEWVYCIACAELGIAHVVPPSLQAMPERGSCWSVRQSQSTDSPTEEKT